MRKHTHFGMLRSAQIIRLYAILNRINYAFYNATEILKIIDVDSEMISGIIFEIYEDISLPCLYFITLISRILSGFNIHISWWQFACGLQPQLL